MMSLRVDAVTAGSYASYGGLFYNLVDRYSVDDPEERDPVQSSQSGPAAQVLATARYDGSLEFA